MSMDLVNSLRDNILDSGLAASVSAQVHAAERLHDGDAVQV